MIEARQLHKSFGAVRAVRDVSFAARDGAITGLLGPNGAGKSTTLRMIATVLAPDSGAVLIDGRATGTDDQVSKLAMGVLPHNAGIYPRLTARENVRYFGRLAGMEAADLERRIDELVEWLEMGEFADRRAQGFSQGQRTKVALARALVHRPRNVVLDEPTNGLDVMATRSLRDLIRRLRDAGHCVLFSSHVMQEVAMLCDEIVIIAHGQVAAAGTPDALRAATGTSELEEAFVKAIGGEEGLAR
jgi:sodium transport system ATP-binding protein